MTISSVGSTTQQVTAQQVSLATLKAAQNDGDGRTGTAALNDGDRAAQQAALQAHSSAGKVDVKA